MERTRVSVEDNKQLVGTFYAEAINGRETDVVDVSLASQPGPA